MSGREQAVEMSGGMRKKICKLHLQGEREILPAYLGQCVPEASV